jgi:hypothetical protein
LANSKQRLMGFSENLLTILSTTALRSFEVLFAIGNSFSTNFSSKPAINLYLSKIEEPQFQFS